MDHHQNQTQPEGPASQPLREDDGWASIPLISVITPSFNQGSFIRETIDSVIAQGGVDWEHIVVDGGSTDETVSILGEYPHVRWVSEQDQGQSDALNKALAMSRGDVIFWINSDDVLAPGAFEAARRFFIDNPDARIVCGNAVTIDGDGNETSRSKPRVRAQKLRRPWDGSTSMQQPSLVFRRAVFEAVGPFDISLHYAMDYDFFLKAAGRFRIHHLAVDFGYFRGHEGTKTGEGAELSFPVVKDCLVRYVRESGDGSPTWTSIRMHFAEACVWVNDAVAHYQNDQPETARQLLFRALRRNPLSLFVSRHLYYRLHQALGPEKYSALRKYLMRKQ